jgi:hypothetical protein
MTTDSSAVAPLIQRISKGTKAHSEKKADGYFYNNLASQSPVQFGLVSFERGILSASIHGHVGRVDCCAMKIK